jgi:hypothetical protein
MYLFRMSRQCIGLAASNKNASITFLSFNICLWPFKTCKVIKDAEGNKELEKYV